MHVWGVTIQGLLSNYIYDGSPRMYQMIMGQLLEKSRIVGENLWIILGSCGQKFIIYFGKIFIVLALL